MFHFSSQPLQVTSVLCTQPSEQSVLEGMLLHKNNINCSKTDIFMAACFVACLCKFYSVKAWMKIDHSCISGEGRVCKSEDPEDHRAEEQHYLDPPGADWAQTPCAREDSASWAANTTRWVLAGAANWGFLSGASVPLEFLPTVHVQSAFISSTLICHELSSTDYILKIKSPEQ